MHLEFSASPRSSLGVEWELELVDVQTRQLSAGSNEILAEIPAATDPECPKAKHELFQSCVEINSGVCTTVAEARQDLADTVKQVAVSASRLGLAVICSGTHPTTDWATQQVTDTTRYKMLIERNQWMARQLQIFGVHVHVGVRSDQKIMPIVGALTQYIPHLLALSASSPFWIGRDTGLASYRSKVFEALPTAGLPYRMSQWSDFEQYVEALLLTNTVRSTREVWWDIRPNPHFGTVELRVCDGLPTLDEVCAVAALSQCLVEVLDTQLDRGYTLPDPPAWMVRENKWRAVRYGLDARILVDSVGTVRPVRSALLELVDDLMPTARRLDCEEELAIVPRILDVGASYQRQRAVAAASAGDLVAVVDSLIEEMRGGLQP
ncbi:MAG: glutamate--cysteine ligase [Actinobacteria bacterium]|nr:glutamate--cysteine ligase [Actinomycetota bacterium]MBI3687893.1 glutamate--cysteine ligase [Actinomycetota bacterium]